MRSGISFVVSSRDRQRLRAIVADPKSRQKHVWRARIVLLSGDGLGTSSIMTKTGKFHSVGDLQAAINRFVGEYNVCDAKPFIWRANPDDIIAARNRGFQTLKSIH